VPTVKTRPPPSTVFPIHQSPYVAVLPAIHIAQGKASQLSSDVRVTGQQTGCAQHLYASYGGCILVEDTRFYLGVAVHALLRTSSQNCEKRILAFSYVCPSVRPHWTRLPLDGYSWNLIFEYFSKICPENSSFIKIWKEYRILYTNSCCTFMIISRWILVRTRNVPEKSCTENQKPSLRSVTSPPKIVPLGNNVEKYDTASHATNDNLIRRMRFSC
jgi:hypothetical protein